ncbi:MAG: gluconolactonase [Humisphaera sp.]|nr:gluconolactonase [Humisphaera sp.]
MVDHDIVSPLLPIDRFEIFANGLDHPECLAFDRNGLLWAGGEAGQVYRIDPTGRAEQIASLGTFNAGVAFNKADELFVCNPAQGIVRVNRNGTHTLFASHAGDHKIVCANYGLFDSRGNYWGTDSGQWMKQNGFLLRFTPDGHGEIVAGPFGYANGLALSADEKTLFMAESNTNRVWRFNVSDGAHTVFAENVGRMPDGLALDSSGHLYVACYASDDLHRIRPDGTCERFAHDPWAILLSRPTNMAFRDGMIYVANLGRYTITRAKL